MTMTPLVFISIFFQHTYFFIEPVVHRPLRNAAMLLNDGMTILNIKFLPYFLTVLLFDLCICMVFTCLLAMFQVIQKLNWTQAGII